MYLTQETPEKNSSITEGLMLSLFRICKFLIMCGHDIVQAKYTIDHHLNVLRTEHYRVTDSLFISLHAIAKKFFK